MRTCTSAFTLPFRRNTLQRFSPARKRFRRFSRCSAAFPVGDASPTSSAYFDFVQETLASSVNENFGSARFDYHINDFQHFLSALRPRAGNQLHSQRREWQRQFRVPRRRETELPI